jgi:hypothetical protein
MVCPDCEREILQMGKHVVRGPSIQIEDWIQVYPSGSSRGSVPPEVPKETASDYTEAANVLDISPKASAALSRRCLQAVLTEAGYKQKDLSKQIDAVLAETDGRKTLPSGIHMIVDAVRNFGNFAAHVITDQTTLQIIDVAPAEAAFCLDVLDSLFDHYYVKPAQAKALKAALDLKLASASKPPAK